MHEPRDVRLPEGSRFRLVPHDPAVPAHDHPERLVGPEDPDPLDVRHGWRDAAVVDQASRNGGKSPPSGTIPDHVPVAEELEIMWRIILIGITSLIGLRPTLGAEEIGPDTVPALTARPIEDTAVVVHNPDMGWVLYENHPLDPDPRGSSTLLTLPGETFPVVDAVAIMASWQDVEKTEGVYDFSRLAFAYDHWKTRGKALQLRVSTETLLWWTKATPPAGTGVPGYVLDRLPAGRKQTRHDSGLPYVVVDAREPYYLERLGRFLDALAKHFSGARAVTLVDLRGFGLWGEWHSGYRYPTLADRREALSHIIDVWSGAFPHNHLALSASYDPDSPAELRAGPTDRFDPAHTTHYAEFLSFSAFDQALTRPNVGFRRDGAGGAVHSNERRLIDEAFAKGKGPMMAEFLGGYADWASKPGRGAVDRIVGDALSLHPNYVNLLGWAGKDALAFTHARPDLVAHGLRTMGYRLVPLSIRYPATITGGHPFRVAMEWVNRGVGRALRDYGLRLILADAKGQTRSTCDAGPLETSRWERDVVYRVQKEVAWRVVPAGEGELRVALTDPGTGRSIALPLAVGSREGGYPMGGVRLIPAVDHGSPREGAAVPFRE
jgi:hypothetical protein